MEAIQKIVKRNFVYKKHLGAILFVGPAFICAAILRYYPLIKAFYYSLFNYNLASPPGKFIGLQNYVSLFKEDFFKESWINTFVYLGLATIITFFIPIIQALFLSEIVKGRSMFSTIYLLTAVIPISIQVVIWKWIWHPDYGIANKIVQLFGGKPSLWLSDPNLTKFCIIFPGILGGGIAVLLYLAAILSIPSDIIESAKLDGCSGFKKIVYIVIPNIRFIVLIQFVFLIINTMQIYDVPYQYTSGGPSGASTSVGLYVYKTFSEDALMGKSNAAAFVLFIIVAILVFMQLKLQNREKE